MSEVDVAERVEQSTAPPKRWFNWWFSHNTDGAPWDDGDTTNPVNDPTPYPSKDVAEAIADRQWDKCLKNPNAHVDGLTYMGAWPEGERP